MTGGGGMLNGGGVTLNYYTGLHKHRLHPKNRRVIPLLENNRSFCHWTICGSFVKNSIISMTAPRK